MNWIIIAALAGLASNGFNIINRYALKDKGDHTAYAWWFELLRTVFFLAIILGQSPPAFTPQNILGFIMIGLTELFSVYVFMKMHALTDLSISSIISRLRVIWSPLLAWALVGERLSAPQYIGITIIFLGMAVVTSPKSIRRDKGVRIALIFAFSSALLSTVQKISGAFVSTEMILVSQGVIPLIVLPLLMKNPVVRIVSVGKAHFSKTLTAGIFNIVSSYLIVEALRVADASKVVGIYQAMTLVSVFYGIFIMKEIDKMWQKVIGSLIVLGGVLLTVM